MGLRKNENLILNQNFQIIVSARLHYMAKLPSKFEVFSYYCFVSALTIDHSGHLVMLFVIK